MQQEKISFLPIFDEYDLLSCPCQLALHDSIKIFYAKKTYCHDSGQWVLSTRYFMTWAQNYKVPTYEVFFFVRSHVASELNLMSKTNLSSRSWISSVNSITASEDFKWFSQHHIHHLQTGNLLYTCPATKTTTLELSQHPALVNRTV